MKETSGHVHRVVYVCLCVCWWPVCCDRLYGRLYARNASARSTWPRAACMDCSCSFTPVSMSSRSCALPFAHSTEPPSTMHGQYHARKCYPVAVRCTRTGLCTACAKRRRTGIAGSIDAMRPAGVSSIRRGPTHSRHSRRTAHSECIAQLQRRADFDSCTFRSPDPPARMTWDPDCLGERNRPARPSDITGTTEPITRPRTPCPQTVPRTAIGRTAADRAVAPSTPTI